jgi:hypothetical protein
MKTVLQEIIESLTKDAEFLDGPNDAKEDKIVGSYLKTIVDDLKENWLQKEKQQIIDAANSALTIVSKDCPYGEQYYNSSFKE